MNVRRAIDIHEGKELDESAFKALVRQSVALNSSCKSKPSKKSKAPRESAPGQARHRGGAGVDAPPMTSGKVPNLRPALGPVCRAVQRVDFCARMPAIR